MAHQLEQLLTCCICLDRFTNPKLLPCQHSVCMEPCMEGLVDYVRRQVKCPECRAEHRIPYNGVQGFPTNVTLQRFLEAHIEITGETPDPHTGQYMERCSVCNEKEYLSMCAHCEKKICVGCKAAHTDILKREIGRINNQVKRAAHRLNDQLGTVERSITALKQNTTSVTEEIENISQRLQKAIRDRCNYLKQEVENSSQSEQRQLQSTKEGMEQEVSNIESNIELAEKHMDDKTPWDDNELMDTKDIFLKTMEFIRSFDYEPGDHKRTKFQPPDDLNKIASTLSTLGEVIIQKSQQSNGNYERNGPGLMKSKSDHRLASQFRDQGDDYSYGSGRSSPQPASGGRPRRFGEPRTTDRGGEEGGDEGGRRKFRSRFMRKDEEEEKSVRFEEEAPKRAIRVLDTEDVARGPLSGIQRLYDCPRVIIRLQEKENGPKTPKAEPAKPPQAATPKPAATPVQKKTSRQTSNEDEIDKIKKQNAQADSTFGGANATSTATTTTHTTSSTTSRPGNERTSSLRDDDRQSRSDRSSVSPRTSTNHSPSSSVTRNESASRTRESSTSRTDYGGSSNSSSRKPSVDTGLQSVQQRAYPFSRSSSTSSVGDSNKSTSGMRSPRTLDTSSIERRLSRSNSTDSNKSGDGAASPKKSTGAAFSTDEIKRRFSSPASSSSTSRTSTTPAANSSGASNRYGSRFLGRAGTPSAEASKESGNEDDEEDSSDDSESEDSDESSEEEEEEEKNHYSDVGPLLGRSAQSKTSHWTDKSTANDSGYGSRYNSSDNSNSSSSNSSRYGASSSNSSSNDSAVRKTSFADTAKKEDGFDNKYPYASKYLNRSRTNMAQPEEEEKPSPFQSRFLNRSKSSAVIPGSGADSEESTSGHGSSRQKFEELKERRQRLARSKSSAGLEEEDSSAAAGSGLYGSRYGAGSSSSTAAASSSASGGASGSANASGDEGSKPQELSNWARYLKNKYGNKTANASGAAATTSSTSSTSTTGASSSTANSLGSSARSESPSTLSANRLISRSRSSHLLGLAKEGATGDDESKNVHATPIPQLAGSQVLTQPIVGFNGNIHRSQYLHKQSLVFKIGSRGSEEGNFTWPRGIAVGPDNSIVVADSSNHRVQVFDQEGNFVTAFGSYGSADGEFDCLAGVAVNRIGQFIIADRYNHRIQVFDPTGTFLRSFGSQGSGDGRFSYPWGVTTDALGFIYVCDKENHRIQVFQSDGSFVGKFGSMGNKEGQLEHPHYIAVSSTNRVIVSDSNNHRIQIFDVNGKVSETFGSEGADEGNFKFPRGVAVDEQGYIFVADSGNNRIQVFQPDGTFVKAFGIWGQGEGEFKGLEGVAVMSNGNILVCDRENHRVQVF